MNPGKFCFKPQWSTMPSGFKIEDLKSARRTVIKTIEGHTKEYYDSWSRSEYRKPLDPPPDNVWTGFTDLFIQAKDEPSEPQALQGSEDIDVELSPEEVQEQLGA